ncbi:MAG: aminotransferase class I/II-fold pyridoxal phosphate-dependent enzyme [Candidatus Mcinerneyibacterium aminivorans]|uniref:Aminotransferase class I/II-fold pyridoxal phosphate-dependent enzyme n=1 Tax=Candidatus Mcinerneyibacterium aminivorans TaxID=2703815 RepID=A0A5D0MIJ1_9BACT|nr:MAG: aminotransferase class I/II-fold pyridoxal phosphate-dependent enzyme [Candidatus Mcinerneyibacterium aminivorans]
MSLDGVKKSLTSELKNLKEEGTLKGEEMVIEEIIPAEGKKGPRYKIKNEPDKKFLKLNSNSYLGISMHEDVIEAEEKAAQKYGVGPGAVRFISGTHEPHIDLEKKLADFHRREDAMILSSAYVTSLGVIFPLLTKETIVISDELNHNCIINAVRMSRPADKKIYKHNDMDDLEKKIKNSIGKAKRVMVVTDGIFSMLGENAFLDKVQSICDKYSDEFEEGIFSVVDDSHGVGAFGDTGRGTEEYCNTKVDILIGTLGKAFGVNGGYVVSDKTVTDYLREKAPTYVYSNPITCSEAAAAKKVLEIVDSKEGQKRLSHLKKMTNKFIKGLKNLGFETAKGEHPVVPLITRDTRKTSEITKYLYKNGILATAINYPVVPKGEEEIRFQINGDHTEFDIEYVLDVLKKY